jgi:hypothetical protein
MVPFPAAFREALALHIDTQRAKGAGFLFESSWKKPYSTRGVRKLLTRYAAAAGIAPIRSARTASGIPAELVDGPRHRPRAHPAIQRHEHRQSLESAPGCPWPRSSATTRSSTATGSERTLSARAFTLVGAGGSVLTTTLVEESPCGQGEPGP